MECADKISGFLQYLRQTLHNTLRPLCIFSQNGGIIYNEFKNNFVGLSLIVDK